MRERRIVKIVDALASQERIILRLECNHTLSITLAALVEHKPTLEDTAICPFCPDVPEAAQAPVKTAQQLWKDAGEP